MSLTSFMLTPRECRELCEALEWASVCPSGVPEHRAKRLWLLFEPFASPERKPRKRRALKDGGT